MSSIANNQLLVTQLIDREKRLYWSILICCASGCVGYFVSIQCHTDVSVSVFYMVTGFCQLFGLFLSFGPTIEEMLALHNGASCEPQGNANELHPQKEKTKIRAKNAASRESQDNANEPHLQKEKTKIKAKTK